MILDITALIIYGLISGFLFMCFENAVLEQNKIKSTILQFFIIVISLLYGGIFLPVPELKTMLFM